MVLTRKQSASFHENRDECASNTVCSANLSVSPRRRNRRQAVDREESCTSAVPSDVTPELNECNIETNTTCTRRLRCWCFYLTYTVTIILLSIVIYSVFMSYSKTLEQIENLNTEINLLRNEILPNQQYEGKSSSKSPGIDSKLISNDLIQVINNSFGRESQKIINELNELKTLIGKIQMGDSKSYDSQFELILKQVDKMQKELEKQISTQSTSLTTAYKYSKKGSPQTIEDRVDYAAESLGGEILSTDDTELLKMYHFGSIFGWIENTPRMVIQPSIYPGECYGFAGQMGSVVIKLMARVFIDSVTVGHIPKDLSPSGDLSTAPRNITVSGLTTPDDSQPTALATFQYDTNKTQMFQTFPVATGIVSFQVVRFNFTSNHGHLNHTCVYRVRVHGKLDDS